MSRYVFLDATPLGLVVNPRRNARFGQWLEGLVDGGDDLAVAEVTDYEVRRELQRARLDFSLRRLDLFLASVAYKPVTTAAWRSAATLWAEVRARGRPTADRHALDADVILAATALEERARGFEVVVATDNPRHLGLFLDARHWSEI